MGARCAAVQYELLTDAVRTDGSGHLEVVESLLEAGANAHIRNAKGWAPVHSAAAAGHLEVVLRLVAAGAAPRSRPDLDVLRMLSRKTTYRCSPCSMPPPPFFLIPPILLGPCVASLQRKHLANPQISLPWPVKGRMHSCFIEPGMSLQGGRTASGCSEAKVASMTSSLLHMRWNPAKGSILSESCVCWM